MNLGSGHLSALSLRQLSVARGAAFLPKKVTDEQITTLVMEPSKVAHINPFRQVAPWRATRLALLAALVASGCDVSNNNGEVTVHEGDPAVVDFPIAYVHRPLPVDEAGDPAALELLEPAAFNPGAKLILRERASASARQRILTDALFDEAAQYDVKDLSVSADGSKLLFALRAPEIEDATDEQQPTWNIWQYDHTTGELSQIIVEGAEAGDDVDPHFLPSGGIVFSSNRQARSRAILTDELKPQYAALDDNRDQEAFVLHTWHDYPDDRPPVAQITYNVSNDLQPTVLDSGKVLFVRHDAVAQHDRISLYTVNPDGSDVQRHYGYHSQSTGTDASAAAFMRPQVLPDGRLLATLQARESVRLGGDIIAIDANNFVEIDQPTSTNIGGGGAGQISLTTGVVNTLPSGISPAGTYSSAYPFYDGTNRLLTSWSPCRLLEQTSGQVRPCGEIEESGSAEPAPPLYGLWIYNPDDATQLPIQIPEEDYMVSEAVVMAATAGPAQWQPEVRDSEWVDTGVGVVDIASVYDLDGTDMTANGIAAMADPARTPVDERPVRFIRIVKNVPIPNDDVFDFDNSAFGRSGAIGMRDIIGYVPVEPDGSALFKVPADIAFTFDLLDGDGKRIGQRHDNWLHLRPGEQRQCRGCHTRASSLPHGRRDAEAASINPGAIGGLPFSNSRLLDEFGTPHPQPEFGETMAQYYARMNGARTPSADLIFIDEWTAPTVAAQGESISWRYLDIINALNNPQNNCEPTAEPNFAWTAPTACTTAGSWTARCRTTVNYPDHIAPLWQADRRICDAETGNLINDATCTSCHTRARDGMAVLPAGQLELTNDISQDRNAYVTSYAELMFNDNEQELSGDSLTDVTIEVDTGEFQTDANGEPVLGPDGQPLPLIEYETVPVPAALSPNGARASRRFFDLFNAGGSHAGWLSAAELKLIAEWLDIGGQYYNDPFAAPAN